MDWLLFVEAVTSRQLDGPVADDLVGVHVGGGARAGLVDVDGALVVEFACGDYAGGLNDRLSDFRLELTQLPIGDGGSDFDQAKCSDQACGQRLAGYREILNRPLGLGAVVSLSGDFHFAHGISLDPEFAHWVLLHTETRSVVDGSSATGQRQPLAAEHDFGWKCHVYEEYVRKRSRGTEGGSA